MDIETMKALCEPSRCRIVSLLSQRAYCVSALATLLELSAPAVSQHLRVLRDAGIVYFYLLSQMHHLSEGPQMAG